MRNKIDFKGLITTAIGMVVATCTTALAWTYTLEPSDALLDASGLIVLLLIGLAFGAFAAIVWYGWR